MSSFLYQILRRLRPSMLAQFLKLILLIRRRTITAQGGYFFYADPISHFGTELLNTGTYEKDLTDVVSGLLRPGDTFLDVGANEGYFSILAGSLVGKTGKVFAVEPQSRLRVIIEKNAGLNQLSNVEVHSVALAESSGLATLHLSSGGNTGATSFYKHWRFGAGRETVATQTMEAFFFGRKMEHVRLVKLDCEGAELSILRGARHLLERHQIDFVVTEFHQSIVGVEPSRQIDSLFRNSGYQLSVIPNGQWIYHLPGLEKTLAKFGKLTSPEPLAA